jgi:hypothetical protein
MSHSAEMATRKKTTERRLALRPAASLHPWSVDDPDMKLGLHCFIVRGYNGQALAYVYFEDEAGRARQPNY